MDISSNESKYEDKMYQMIDAFTISILTIVILVEYFNSTKEEKDRYVTKRLKQFRDYLDDPYSIISMLLFLLAVYLIVYFLHLSMDSNESVVIWLIHNVSFLLIMLMLIVDFFKFFFQINLVEIVLTDWLIPGWLQLLPPTPVPKRESLLSSNESFVNLQANEHNNNNANEDVAAYMETNNKNSPHTFSTYVIG